MKKVEPPACAALAAALLFCAPATAEAIACAATVEELGKLSGQPFPLRWQGTGMADGKPLVVTLMDREGRLFLEFDKSGEGLWAHGHAVICTSDAGMEARMSAGMRPGPAAHWILRHSMGRNASFTLSPLPDGRLRIATPGWSSVFAAQPR